ncbi:MAG: outer membrane lipoprotein-sorting protein [Thermodesulfobacteriota bacterium]
MECRSVSLILFFIGMSVFTLHHTAHAMTAQEILDKGFRENLGESFRVALELTSPQDKGKAVKHAFWFMGRRTKDKSSYFVDFDQPEESKGLRFLFVVPTGGKPEAYMYLPASRKTLPLVMDDSSADLGGTGLTMEDLRAFIPEGDKDASIVKEEKIDGRDCYVIKIPNGEGKGYRLTWITKDGLLGIKTQHVGMNGKPTREFRVVEFFETEQGKVFPREEEITIPDKRIKMRLRQEHAVFGIEIPDEVMDPKQFGTFRWKI